MHAIYFVLNLFVNSNKFKLNLYSNCIKIIYIIIYYFFINQYLYNQLES